MSYGYEYMYPIQRPQLDRPPSFGGVAPGSEHGAVALCYFAYHVDSSEELVVSTAGVRNSSQLLVVLGVGMQAGDLVVEVEGIGDGQRR